MYLTFVDSAPLPMPPPPTPPRPVFFHPTRPIILARNFLRFSISSTRLSRYRTLSDIEGEGEGGHSRVLHSRVVERLLVSSRFVLSFVPSIFYRPWFGFVWETITIFTVFVESDIRDGRRPCCQCSVSIFLFPCSLRWRSLKRRKIAIDERRFAFVDDFYRKSMIPRNEKFCFRSIRMQNIVCCLRLQISSSTFFVISDPRKSIGSRIWNYFYGTLNESCAILRRDRTNDVRRFDRGRKRRKRFFLLLKNKIVTLSLLQIISRK